MSMSPSASLHRKNALSATTGIRTPLCRWLHPQMGQWRQQSCRWRHPTNRQRHCRVPPDRRRYGDPPRTHRARIAGSYNKRDFAYATHHRISHGSDVSGRGRGDGIGDDLGRACPSFLLPTALATYCSWLSPAKKGEAQSITPLPLSCFVICWRHGPGKCPHWHHQQSTACCCHCGYGRRRCSRSLLVGSVDARWLHHPEIREQSRRRRWYRS